MLQVVKLCLEQRQFPLFVGDGDNFPSVHHHEEQNHQ